MAQLHYRYRIGNAVGGSKKNIAWGSKYFDSVQAALEVLGACKFYEKHPNDMPVIHREAYWTKEEGAPA